MKRFIYIFLIVIFAVLFIFSGYRVVDYYLNSRAQSQLYDDLAMIVEDSKDETEASEPSSEPPETEPEETEPPTEPPMLDEYLELYELNPDMVGWLKIEDTKINYPVMQSPQDPNFYLYRDFYRNYNVNGCLYAQESCDINTPSDNITIFGHHMKNGSMFYGLDKFRNQQYWENHKTFTFDTLYYHHTYEIFAVFKTSASGDFAYHAFVNAADEAEFDEFIAKCKELSYFDTGITPVYGDKIICLSTCEYSLYNGRLVVAAVRVD